MNQNTANINFQELNKMFSQMRTMRKLEGVVISPPPYASKEEWNAYYKKIGVEPPKDVDKLNTSDKIDSNDGGSSVKEARDTVNV